MQYSNHAGHWTLFNLTPRRLKSSLGHVGPIIQSAQPVQFSLYLARITNIYIVSHFIGELGKPTGMLLAKVYDPKLSNSTVLTSKNRNLRQGAG